MTFANKNPLVNATLECIGEEMSSYDLFNSTFLSSQQHLPHLKSCLRRILNVRGRKICRPFSDYGIDLYSQTQILCWICLTILSILISTWIGNLISKRWCLLEAHHTLWSGSDVSMSVGTQLLHSVSFTAPHCWLLIVYGSSLLIVIFPPDCNCWSWLSAVDCGDQWWERRKPARWERGATTTTAGGWVCKGSGGLGPKFCQISSQTHVRWDPNWVNLQVLLAVLCLKYWVPKTADNKKSAKCARIVPDFSGPF